MYGDVQDDQRKSDVVIGALGPTRYDRLAIQRPSSLNALGSVVDGRKSTRSGLTDPIEADLLS